VPTLKFSTCFFGQSICSYILSSWYVLDLYPIKTGLHNIQDQVIILEESCVFNLKLVVEVSNCQLGIYFSY